MVRDLSTYLILGGARSGKSGFAERLVEASGPARIYLATGEARDGEMADRIAEHRARRGAGWTTVEEPLEVATRFADLPGEPVLVDCLTLWLSNLMEAGRDVGEATAALMEAASTHPAPVVMVSNEVGLGLVPETPLGRAFRDAQGRLNQAVAAEADTVVFVAAGLPMVLKGALP